MPNPAPEPLFQGSGKVLVPFSDFDTARGRGPHQVRSALPELRGRNSSPAGRYAIVAGSAWVSGFRHSVHEDRPLAALGSSGKMNDGTEGSLRFYLFLKQNQTLQNRFGAGRAARDVDIHRQDLVDALDDAVNIVHAATVGAGSHGHDPLGFGHLLVEPQNYGCHLFEYGSGSDEKIGLPGGPSENLGAETADVVAGRIGYHHLDEAAGQAEKHGPETVLPRPVDEIVDSSLDQVFHVFGRFYLPIFQSSAPFFQM